MELTHKQVKKSGITPEHWKWYRKQMKVKSINDTTSIKEIFEKTDINTTIHSLHLCKDQIAVDRLLIKLITSVLPIYSEHYPNDLRPKQAVLAYKRFIEGKCKKDHFLSKIQASNEAAIKSDYDLAWLVAKSAALEMAWDDQGNTPANVIWSIARIHGWKKFRDISWKEVENVLTKYLK